MLRNSLGAICRLNILHKARMSSIKGIDKPVEHSQITDIPIIDYDYPVHLPIPEYPSKVNEPLLQQKRRLLYQSRKRGILENDLLLSTFASKYLENMSEEETDLYDKLINGINNDWDIYYWATNAKPTPPEFDNKLMAQLKQHVLNEKKEERLRQPDL